MIFTARVTTGQDTLAVNSKLLVALLHTDSVSPFFPIVTVLSEMLDTELVVQHDGSP